MKIAEYVCLGLGWILGLWGWIEVLWKGRTADEPSDRDLHIVFGVLVAVFGGVMGSSEIAMTFWKH